MKRSTVLCLLLSGTSVGLETLAAMASLGTPAVRLTSSLASKKLQLCFRRFTSFPHHFRF